MNATTIRLNTMPVRHLKGVARNMGIKGVSALRKAELVNALTIFIDGAHIDALKMNAEFDAMPTRSHTDVFEAGLKFMFIQGKSYTALNADERCALGDKIVRLAKARIVKPIIEPFADNIPSDTYSIDYGRITGLVDSEEKEMDANSAAIEIANSGINALTPVLATAKATFEGIRDKGTDEEISIAYQVYCDVTRAIEELTRTIGYAESN